VTSPARSSAGRPAAIGGRFHFVDGLRGLAALAVVLPHSSGLFAYPTAGWVLRTMVALVPYGGRAVQVFFVISGFVIAYSLRDAARGSFALKTFVLRRAIRLDPPYWCAILAMLAAEAFHSVAAHRPFQLPPAGSFVAHLFYLQQILGYGSINIVFWTLCLEFQLYVVFALLLAGTGLIARGDRLDRTLRPTLVIGCFLGSLVLAHTIWPNDVIGAWFVPNWYQFLAGVLLCWQMLGRVTRRQLLFCELCMVAAFVYHPDSCKLSALLATGVIDLAIQLRKLDTWLAGPIAQRFGRLSYCIYLLHVPVSIFVLGARTRISATSDLVAFAMLGLLYALTIVAAQMLHVTVEVPCLRLASRLRGGFARPVAPAEEAVAATPALVGSSEES
jgi:peptidoglycan/LPS O-acetylase OafA/YrhL